MARRNNRQRRRPKRRNARQRRKNVAVSSKTIQRPSLGKLIGRGVREIIGLIPGAKLLKSAADVIFKSMGVGVYETDGLHIQGPSVYTGVATRFTFSAQNLCCSTRFATATSDPRKFQFSYGEVRIKNVQIQVSMNNDMEHRSGEVILALQPLFSTEVSAAPPGSSYPDVRDINKWYVSARGPADRPLRISYTPTPVDGRAYLFNNPSDRYAEVVIMFVKRNRALASELTPTDVSFDIIMSGSIEMRTSTPSSVTWTYEDKFEDLLTDVSVNLTDVQSNIVYDVAGATHRCENDQLITKGRILCASRYGATTLRSIRSESDAAGSSSTTPVNPVSSLDLRDMEL